MLKYFINDFTIQLLLWLSYVILVYHAVVCVVHFKQMLLSLSSIPAYMRKVRFLDMKTYSKSNNIVPFSILVPAYNEEKTIVDSLKSLLTLNYSTYEIIIINDGSTDETLETVIDAFDLKPTNYPLRSRLPTAGIRGVYFNPDLPLLLVDKENGGKADALNAGINISQYPYFASLDADSLLDSDALIRIALAFLEYKYTIAVGGIIRVANGCKIKDGKITEPAIPKKSIERFQAIEYLRAFLIGRVGWGHFNSLMIISGAFGAFQKESVLKVGGYTVGTVGEDMELVMKLHQYMREKKYQYIINFLPDPVCWTQVPSTFKDLFKQRSRWQVGLIDSLHRGGDMLLNHRFGYLGMVSMPYFVLCEMMGPVAEILGIFSIPLAYFLGILHVEFFVMYLVMSLLFGIIISVVALMVEDYTFNKYPKLTDVIVLSLYSVLDNFSYRPLTMIFRLIATLRFRKLKHSWGKVKRHTFAAGAVQPKRISPNRNLGVKKCKRCDHIIDWTKPYCPICGGGVTQIPRPESTTPAVEYINTQQAAVMMPPMPLRRHRRNTT